MRKLLPAAVATLAVALVTATSIAAAPLGLRLIGSGRSSGDFAIATADGSADNARGLYVRGYGRDLSGTAIVTCSRGFTSIGSKTTDLDGMRSGRVLKLRMPFRGDCDVIASMSGSGTIRLQILAG